MSNTLQVEGKPFLEALKLLRLGLSRKNAELLISFNGTDLALHFQGIDVKVPAEGRWPGTARVTARTLIALTKAPPSGKRLTLRHADGRFYVNSWSVSAAWQDIAPLHLELPIDASYIELMALTRIYSGPQLAASGLGPKIEGVAKDVAKSLDRAARALAAVGITRAELETLVEQKVGEKLATHISCARVPQRLWFPGSVRPGLRAVLAVMIPAHKHRPTPSEYSNLMEIKISELVSAAEEQARVLVENHMPEIAYYLNDDVSHITAQIVMSDRLDSLIGEIDWDREEEITPSPADIEDVLESYRELSLESLLEVM